MQLYIDTHTYVYMFVFFISVGTALCPYDVVIYLDELTSAFCSQGWAPGRVDSVGASGSLASSGFARL